MYEVLATGELKTGEPVEVGLVTGLDEDHADELVQFLSHKGPMWVWQGEQTLQRRLDRLETRYYVAKLQGKIISNIMTVECDHSGILGHVFTAETHRRRGACSVLMKHAIDGFNVRQGCFVLGTGYNSPAYWIYHRFGFRSVHEESGRMKLCVPDDFESSYFRPGEGTVCELGWAEWPKLSVLAMQSPGDWIRSVAYGLFGEASFEGPYLRFRQQREEGKAPPAKGFCSETGALGAYAFAVPDSRWKGHAFVVDIFAHPNFSNQLPDVLSALDLPTGKYVCFAESNSAAKIEALHTAGFQHEGTLRNQTLRRGETRKLDVAVFGKYVE